MSCLALFILNMLMYEKMELPVIAEKTRLR